MGRPSKYPRELRERAVRMVAEVRSDYPSEYAAMIAVAQMLGVGSPETIRTWIRRQQVEAGDRPGVTTDAAVKTKRLKRENAELRRANEMADSSGGRNEFCELLRWCQIAERFAGSSVERVLDRGQLNAGDDAQIGAASTFSALFPSGRCSRSVRRVLRSTRVPTALRLFSPRIKSPSVRCWRGRIRRWRSVTVTLGQRVWLSCLPAV